MYSSARQRVFRVAVTGILLLMQMHLLWLAELHWHEMHLRCGGGNTAVRREDPHSTPVRLSDRFCAVCQIVNQNALRPQTGIVVRKPLPVSSFHPFDTTRAFEFFQPAPARGRAPPAV